MCSRHGSYKLVDADEQWQLSQHQQQLQQLQRRGRSAGKQKHRGGKETKGEKVVNHLCTGSEIGVRRSGYVNSGAETEAETVVSGAASLGRRTRRRQRSRSRSPGVEARNRLPAEVLQHVDFELIEPNQDNMKGLIPFTNVETAKPIKVKNYNNNKPMPPPPSHHHPSFDQRSRHTSGGSSHVHARRM